MSAARDRVRRLVEGARRIADPSDPVGARARRVLPSSTGLSAEGVELALGACLETHPTEDDLDALLASVEPAPRAWVLLSANVFTAAHRAIALALAGSERVLVCGSRREPEMARLLQACTDSLFELVSGLEPAPGDVVFGYGRDETLAAVRATLPSGTRLVAHGSGFGVVAIRPDDAALEDVAEVAARLARDVVLFDQRGCLSPRLVLCEGSVSATEAIAEAITEALIEYERLVPLGAVHPDEQVAAARYRQTVTYAGTVRVVGGGAVGVVTDVAARLMLPPSGRNVHVARVDDVVAALAPAASRITAIGFDDAALERRLAEAVPGARRSRIGSMQTPPFDGPVDRRGLGP